MLHYREATLADLHAICALGAEVNALHAAAWPHIFAAAKDPRDTAGHWLQNIGRPGAATIVAEASQALVGFVSVAVVDESNALLTPLRYARIGSIGVTHEHRGQGIGRGLMAEAEAWATARGAVDIRLNVWAFNESALRLYRTLGYDLRSRFLGKRLDVPQSPP